MDGEARLGGVVEPATSPIVLVSLAQARETNSTELETKLVLLATQKVFATTCNGFDLMPRCRCRGMVLGELITRVRHCGKWMV